MRKAYQNKPSEYIRNFSLEKMREILSGVTCIYVYPHHEIKLSDEGEFQQTRSGPNWEGDLVTMTTCKHLLRTYKTIDESGRVAICGVTNKLDGENFLMYIGVVRMTFNSMDSLSAYLQQNEPKAFKAKDTRHNRLGDLFVPAYDLTGEERYDSMSFHEPVDDHCRKEELDSKGQPKWFKDIEYVTRNGTHPKSLILEPVTVHTEPNYIWIGKLGRSGTVFKGEQALDQFLDNLMELL